MHFSNKSPTLTSWCSGYFVFFFFLQKIETRVLLRKNIGESDQVILQNSFDMTSKLTLLLTKFVVRYHCNCDVFKLCCLENKKTHIIGALLGMQTACIDANEASTGNVVKCS